MGGEPGADASEERPRARQRWTFLTHHAHILLCIAQQRDVRVRDIAQNVGITERATQQILSDLIREGYVTSQRVGRRNRYEVNADGPFRHPLLKDRSIGELLEALAMTEPPS